MHEIVRDDEESSAHASSTLVLEPTWDTACGVHLYDMLDHDATIVGLPAHPCNNVISDDVFADLSLVGLDEGLVASTRVEKNASTILFLMLVVSCQSAAV